MSLADVATGLRQFVGMVTGPGRNQLVAERDGLLAAVPPAPASTITLPEPPTCKCPTCTHAFQEEKERYVKFAAWAGRVKVLGDQLFRLTFGGDAERDDPGQALADLRDELLQEIDTQRARDWERTIIRDGRGKTISAYEIVQALGEINATLLGLYRQAHDVMLYLGTDELLQAIEETRARMKAALDTPLKKTLTPDEAKRAGTHPARVESDADRAGLRPGATPNVLEGNIRFGRP